MTMACVPAGRLVTRFAPSPTGPLHLGTAAAALIAADAAGPDGRFLLRIEDIDQTRCRETHVQSILEDLAWLGLTWEDPVRRQSEHFAEYERALQRLRDRGVLYPCFCTRSDIAREVEQAGIAPHGPDGPVYPGTCRTRSDQDAAARIAAGQAYAWRLDVTKAVATAGSLIWHDAHAGAVQATPEVFGDVVVGRKDVPGSYHLACTWDDAVQGVTLVTRGRELFAATHIHRLLQALLDLPTPAYAHHALRMGADGRKLSKRDGALTLGALRAAGHTPAAVRALALEGLQRNTMSS